MTYRHVYMCLYIDYDIVDKCSRVEYLANLGMLLSDLPVISKELT